MSAESSTFEFGWIGYLGIMTSGGFGAVGILALLQDQIAAFVLFGVVLSSLFALAPAVE
ncbi:MAG: hypothetical protein ABEI75_01210 [Halobaculum sp.]